MRRLHDPLYRTFVPPRGVVRAVEQRALTLIEDRPGVTVVELRDALAVGTKRIWQVIERLEWLGAMYRDGAPPCRLGPRRRHIPTVQELLGPEVPARLHAQHQAINTMLIFEHLSEAPCSAVTLADRTGAPYRTVRKLLARLEQDGYVTASAIGGRRVRVFTLASASYEFGRTLAGQ